MFCFTSKECTEKTKVLRNTLSNNTIIRGFFHAIMKGEDTFLSSFDTKMLTACFLMLEITGTRPKKLWGAEELNNSMPTAVMVDGTLRIAEATSSSYRELSSADVLGGEKRPRIFATPPVLCNGKIYCRNYAGDLICVDVSK